MIRGYRLINTKVENTKCGAVWYGGTFDPPHSGHQKIIRYLADLPNVQTVIVTPAYLSPFKQDSLASPEQRLAWMHRLFDGPNIMIDDSECMLVVVFIQKKQYNASKSTIPCRASRLDQTIWNA